MGFPRQEHWSGLPLPSPGAGEAPCKQPLSTGSMKGRDPSQEDDSWAPQGRTRRRLASRKVARAKDMGPFESFEINVAGHHGTAMKCNLMPF